MAFKESTGSPVGHMGGIMMGGEGPMMSGTWVNPKTGHKFTVRDCFFQDGNFMVQTTTGQMLDYNTIQHYVQTSDNTPLTPQKQKPKPKAQAKQPKPEAIPEDLMNEILPEDMEAIGLGNINDPTRNKTLNQPVPTTVVPPVADPDAAMVDRVLKNHAMPEPVVSLDWNPVPRKQIETLVDVLGVKPQSIANYYISKLSMSKIAEAVKAAIVECVLSIAGEPTEIPDPNLDEPAEMGDPVVKEEKKITTKKKSTTKKTKKS